MTAALLMKIFFLAAVGGSDALSFNYTVFNGSDTNITYERTYVNNDRAIQLTSNNRANIGRATYQEAMQLWDNSTGNLTDFATYFSFVIDSANSSHYGDGMAFFLAPAGSKIPINLTKGGSLGLTSYDLVLNSSSSPFVAVEFDIYRNIGWDPPGTHAGIDIDSMQSVTNITWLSDVRDGKVNEAWINYDSRTKNLSVVFTGYRNETRVLQYLSHVVDLRSVLPPQVVFGFSASTGNASAAHTVLAWNFSSSLEITRAAMPPSAVSSPVPVPGSQRGNKTALAVGLSIGLIFLFVLLGLAWFFGWRRMRNGDRHEQEDEILQYMDDEIHMAPSGPKKFSYAELAKSTGNFKEEEKLGEGGFGGVYRGFLQSTGSYVAVKRISSGSKQGVKEYASEIKIISRLRHRNLVQLIGWCHERKELLLVYEFMPNGSLDTHLFKEQSYVVPWETRYRIAQGLASALLYLHEEWEQCVVHRDIKSSNIMLDADFNAKLGDFGLARLVDHAKGSQTTVLAGTMGYMAPECAQTFRATKESDVYSFGVVCLEIACGRKPVDMTLSEEEVVLVGWVWGLHEKGEILKAADPRLGTEFDVREMESLLTIGLCCTLPDTRLRPSAKQALQVLEFSIPLPVLPAEVPVGLANYFSLREVPGRALENRHYSLTTTGTTTTSNQTISSSQISVNSAASSSSSALYAGR